MRRRIQTLTPIINPLCASVRLSTNAPSATGDAAEPLQMQLNVEHTSVLTVAMSAGRRDGITLTEHSTDPTNTRDLTANEMGVHMLPSAERSTIALSATVTNRSKTVLYSQISLFLLKWVKKNIVIDKLGYITF